MEKRNVRLVFILGNFSKDMLEDYLWLLIDINHNCFPVVSDSIPLDKNSISLIPNTPMLVGRVGRPKLELKDILSFNEGECIEVSPTPFIFERLNAGLEEVKVEIIKSKEIPFYVKKNQQFDLNFHIQTIKHIYSSAHQ